MSTGQGWSNNAHQSEQCFCLMTTARFIWTTVVCCQDCLMSIGEFVSTTCDIRREKPSNIERCEFAPSCASWRRRLTHGPPTNNRSFDGFWWWQLSPQSALSCLLDWPGCAVAIPCHRLFTSDHHVILSFAGNAYGMASKIQDRLEETEMNWWTSDIRWSLRPAPGRPFPKVDPWDPLGHRRSADPTRVRWGHWTTWWCSSQRPLHISTCTLVLRWCTMQVMAGGWRLLSTT